MATDDAVFIDTNVLVYAKLALSPFHVAAETWLKRLEAQEVELRIGRQTLGEYLSAMTRPHTLTEQIPVPALIQDVRDFMERFQVAEDGGRVTVKLLSLMNEVPIGGKQVHDANIVATMLVYGIPRLLTHNGDDFKRFAHHVEIIPLVHPQ